MIVHTPWSRSLGAPRVQLELGEELEQLGWEVEKFSYEDAFPRPSGRHLPGKLGRLVDIVATNRSFAARARRFVARDARRFDVIDANQTDLPFPKASLGFRSLLVARSVGLIPAYEVFESFAATRWPRRASLRDRAVRLLTAPGKRRRNRDVAASFRHADLINVSNEEDRETVASTMGFGDKVVRFPFGLSDRRRQAFLRSRADVATRRRAAIVAFIGAWNHRKGAGDWPAIAAQVVSREPRARFRLLGTVLDAAFVRACFPAELRERVEVLPTFDNEDLPRLLSDATVGAFPGYLEGFGFAVLEKLAAGLPTIAYDASGPRDMLRWQALPTSVPAGDTAAFAARVAEMLRLSPEAYGQHLEDSLQVASRFRWPAIARATADLYEQRWERLASAPPRAAGAATTSGRATVIPAEPQAPR